ncbi:hypothetical protein PG995_012021 [Apiospora arundinis]
MDVVTSFAGGEGRISGLAGTAPKILVILLLGPLAQPGMQIFTVHNENDTLYLICCVTLGGFVISTRLGLFYHRTIQRPDIDHTKFQIRLAQLLNTLYMTGISPHTMLGIVPAERARYDTSEELIRNTELNTTMVSATVTVEHDVLRCDKGWFVALLVASLILLAATVMGAIFRGLSLGPDIFGSLSLATLDNQCNDIASGGSALDGIERARLLKRVGIKLGDVEPSSTVGRIALVAELNDRPVGKLERRRAYE